MARTKGMLNLSGNLEVNAQAPLDARTIVPTEADLTVASNFPYPYVGLEVYVTGIDKKFRLTNLDTTQSSSWHEIGEGGGGSGLPSGGTQGQYLVKQSSTEGDADWQTLSAFGGATSQSAGSAGLVPAPSAGDEDKVLFGNGAWGALPSVDLSVLSNEAFQFSPTEKVVGTWTDDNNVTKLLYARTFNCGALTNAGEKSVSTGLSNVIIRHTFGQSKSSAYDIPVPYPDVYIYYGYSDNKIYIRNDTDRSSYTSTYATLFYTKTTDSPLASDVKFAGVTSSGEVILKKEWTGLNSTINGNSWGDVSGVSTANMSKIIDCKVYSSGDIRYYAANTERGSNNTLRLFNNRGSNLVIDAVTLYYTLAS